jgi:hypothetical protein
MRTVDDRDLAMVAQVKTHEQRPQRVHRQDFDDPRHRPPAALATASAPEERAAAE